MNINKNSFCLKLKLIFLLVNKYFAFSKNFQDNLLTLFINFNDKTIILKFFMKLSLPYITNLF